MAQIFGVSKAYVKDKDILRKISDRDEVNDLKGQVNNLQNDKNNMMEDVWLRCYTTGMVDDNFLYNPYQGRVVGSGRLNNGGITGLVDGHFTYNYVIIFPPYGYRFNGDPNTYNAFNNSDSSWHFQQRNNSLILFYDYSSSQIVEVYGINTYVQAYKL